MELTQYGLFEWTPILAVIFDICLLYKLILFIYTRSME